MIQCNSCRDRGNTGNFGLTCPSDKDKGGCLKWSLQLPPRTGVEGKGGMNLRHVEDLPETTGLGSQVLALWWVDSVYKAIEGCLKFTLCPVERTEAWDRRVGKVRWFQVWQYSLLCKGPKPKVALMKLY